MNEALATRIRNGLEFLEGWAIPEKALAMAELIEETKPELVVELGVFGGKSLIPQAMALAANSRGIIVGVDPWCNKDAIEGWPDDENAKWWRSVDMHKIHQGYMEAVWGFGLKPYIVTIRGTSEQASLLIPSNIDILHIDSNHSEAASCADVNTYLPKVKVGGYVWMDDTNWPSTQKAVEILKSRCTELRTVSAPGVESRLYRKCQE